jgi:hypothetical protein
MSLPLRELPEGACRMLQKRTQVAEAAAEAHVAAELLPKRMSLSCC